VISWVIRLLALLVLRNMLTSRDFGTRFRACLLVLAMVPPLRLYIARGGR